MVHWISNNIALLLSSLITQLVYVWAKPTVVVVTEVVVEQKKDPSGLVRNDIAFLERHIPAPGYKPSDTLEKVAYRQGAWDVLENIIKAKMIYKR